MCASIRAPRRCGSTCSNSRWRFEVRDNGGGFDSMRALDETHVGLRIMKERAAQIGGGASVAPRWC
jgi:two-component system nitrate/nitrite sensor histidine kinase NarX